MPTHCSQGTNFNQYLKKEGLQSVVKAKVPKLTANHVAVRLCFVDLHLKQDVEYWKAWTFSDESSFHLECSKGVQRIMIRKNERYLPRNVAGDGKLIIWSHISWAIFTYGGINADKYKQILIQTAFTHL
jgi:hypothetical protein